MNADELWEFIKNDTRTPGEIFESLRQRIQKMSGGKLSEKDSIEATRNLLGFCETIMGFGTQHRKRLANDENTSNIDNEASDGFGV
jgi:hypothetical protein